MKRAVLFLLIVFALAGCYDRVDLNEVGDRCGDGARRCRRRPELRLQSKF